VSGVTVSDRRLVTAVGVLLLGGVIVGAGAFLADPGAATPEPVPFDDTIQRGFPVSVEQEAATTGASVPKAQVFYSQFGYVVGYSGVGQAVAALQRPERERQFGYPLVVYVSDYEGTGATCEGGTLRTGADPGWVAADDAAFVVGSSAETPAGEVVIPFGSHTAAESFASDCGGEVLDWSAVRERPFELQQASDVRGSVDTWRGSADERIDAGRELLDRPVETVVDPETSTVQAAVDAAPPNTTVLIEGTFEGNVTIRKPLTLRGRNATIRGTGNGTVVGVRADRAAVADVRIEGVGDARQEAGTDLDDPSEEWDARFERAYGYADAGVTVANATGVYLRNVHVETPTSGIIFRNAPNGIVEGVSVNGTRSWTEGFMSLTSIRSPVVVQDSVFTGGRDGVYLHRADGTVVRNNTFRGGRFGVHLMFSSETLIAGNRATGQGIAGFVIMTDPTANAIVGNEVRNATDGIVTAGSRVYVARNVVVDTDRAISGAAGQSIYENNVMYDNDVGMVASALVPSSRVVDNDFVANDRHAIARLGPLRVYTHDGRGNYWEGAAGRARPDGTLDTAYEPTSPVDRRLHRIRAAATLRSAPSVRGIRALRGTIPGLRSASIVDTAPLAEPANPDLLADARNGSDVGSGGDSG
jgi:parallel beta-helix repeat protein